MSGFFSAGDWTVKPGHGEKDFTQAWLASVDMDPPIRRLVNRPRLLRDLDRPGHFLSFAGWEGREAISEFRSRPDFPTVIGAIREHADFTIFALEHIAEE